MSVHVVIHIQTSILTNLYHGVTFHILIKTGHIVLISLPYLDLMQNNPITYFMTVSHMVTFVSNLDARVMLMYA